MEQLIIQTAEKLGMEAARIWPQVVMVTWVRGVFWSVVDPIIFVLCVIGLIKLIRVGIEEYQREKVYYLDDSMGLFIFLTFGGVGLIFFTLLSLISWPDQLTAAFYPEAVTVMNLVKLAKP